MGKYTLAHDMQTRAVMQTLPVWICLAAERFSMLLDRDIQ